MVSKSGDCGYQKSDHCTGRKLSNFPAVNWGRVQKQMNSSCLDLPEPLEKPKKNSKIAKMKVVRVSAPYILINISKLI